MLSSRMQPAMAGPGTAWTTLPTTPLLLTASTNCSTTSTTSSPSTPPHLLPYLNAAQGDKARLTASTYRQTAHVLTTPHRDVRASQLELTAHRLGHHHLADHITQTTPHRPWKTTWSHGKKTTDHLILTGHTGGVVAVATGTLSDGTPVAVSGDGDGTVRVWRLDDGTAYGEPLTGHTGPVVAVATGTLRDGIPVAVTGDGKGTVRVWRLDSCVAVPPPLVLPGPALVAVAGNLIITGCGSDLAVHQHHLMLEAPESR